MTKLHPERSDVLRGWLLQAAIDIRAGKITMREAAKNIHFLILHCVVIQERSVSTLKRMFSENYNNICQKFNKEHKKDCSEAEEVFKIIEQYPASRKKISEMLQREKLS